MFTFLTVVQAIVAAALVGVILMQRSEGGGLTGGGSPAGLVSARGAADLLTRTTAILAVVFVSLSIALAVLAVDEGSGEAIDQSLDRSAPAPDPLAPAPDPLAPSAPISGDPLSGAAQEALQGEEGDAAAGAAEGEAAE
ncbi:preprotein translocase subunit SecG [Alterisphingorhabdus coralli]|uniref:Protein-export membrane protein SecG n=1 Tax=Alterisphingorhabdus coralli TaxID=3071408 RepID=A0AA97F4M8_9SPHN|nr:preprotein translocase subunit SecG [Parasphingorhabdus sp. SCSIO 66989]WOE73951.1 preprotein translocase subunit SecG [Parasphingorhabdus sp. SCSIO 66989]